MIRSKEGEGTSKDNLSTLYGTKRGVDTDRRTSRKGDGLIREVQEVLGGVYTCNRKGSDPLNESEDGVRGYPEMPK